MKLNQEEIKTILPHRDPMLLVTSVEELTPGEGIRASFYADPAREIFPGHFPGNPVLPGVYTVEEFNPDPFLDALDKYGLPRSENHDPVLVD